MRGPAKLALLLSLAAPFCAAQTAPKRPAKKQKVSAAKRQPPKKGDKKTPPPPRQIVVSTQALKTTPPPQALAQTPPLPSTAAARVARSTETLKDPSLTTALTMKNGKMMLVLPGGELIPMRNDWRTTDGTRVQMTGQVYPPNGQMTILQEGDSVLSDGTFKKKGN